MTIQMLIAHAGEEDQAELLAKPLAETDYEPVNYGTIFFSCSPTPGVKRGMNNQSRRPV